MLLASMFIVSGILLGALVRLFSSGVIRLEKQMRAMSTQCHLTTELNRSISIWETMLNIYGMTAIAALGYGALLLVTDTGEVLESSRAVSIGIGNWCLVLWMIGNFVRAIVSYKWLLTAERTNNEPQNNVMLGDKVMAGAVLYAADIFFHLLGSIWAVVNITAF